MRATALLAIALTLASGTAVLAAHGGTAGGSSTLMLPHYQHNSTHRQRLHRHDYRPVEETKLTDRQRP
jgi:Spy/CpxP family protein refolding chaperone